MKRRPKKTPKEREFEVEIFIDGMESPEIATLTIVAKSPKEAIKWVKRNMRISAEIV